MKHLPRAEIAAMSERPHRHQFNENALRMTRTLGELCGFATLGIHLVRLEPGSDSTQFHYHDSDEEFVYILSGQGRAFIGDAIFPVSPGDFMGFPCPSAASSTSSGSSTSASAYGHGLHNDSDADLCYLVGGESNAADVVHYPWIRRTMIKSYGRRSWVDWEDLHDL